ncbi:MAG: hypothetical protein B1H07_01180 [Campylobacteraceae bacterium 4484_166]|nr:MAG: hypothetical protein B1H07_01180 [Campylobacteraceae bacterium 4484_166]
MSIFLSNNIVTLFFIQTILLLFSIYSLFISLNIIKNWDFNKTTSYQYNLEKKSYLISLIIFFVIFVKIILFIFFVNSLDGLSSIVPGAMCASGIINANEYGTILLFFKIFVLAGFGIWLVLNKLDIEALDYPYLVKKYYLFLVLFLSIVIEFVLEFLYFTNISIKRPVLCCSAVFQDTQGFASMMKIEYILILFYINYIALIISNVMKNSLTSLLSGALFLVLSYFSIVYFFGTYIYELPTHKCPFCMLQEEYFYIGYIIWITMFLAVFFSISSFIIEKFIKKEYNGGYKLSIIFSTIFVLLCSYYVLAYYITNGVFL